MAFSKYKCDVPFQWTSSCWYPSHACPVIVGPASSAVDDVTARAKLDTENVSLYKLTCLLGLKLARAGALQTEPTKRLSILDVRQPTRRESAQGAERKIAWVEHCRMATMRVSQFFKFAARKVPVALCMPNAI